MQYTYLRHLKVEMVVTHNPRRGGADSMLGKPYQYTFQLWQNCGGPHLWVTHFQWSAADALYGQKHLQDRYHLWRYMLDVSMIKKSATLRAKRSIVLGLPIFDAVWLARPQFQCEFVYRVVMKERLLFYIFIYLFVCHLHTHTHTKINYSCLQQSIIITILTSLHNNLYLIQIKLKFRVIYK